MPPSYRHPGALLIALSLASLTTAAAAGDLIVSPIHNIDLEEQRVVSLVGVEDKCMYFGALSGEEHEATGFLARLGAHVEKIVGGRPLKDWTLTIQRQQCNAGVIETVNGTVRLGELVDPVPAGTSLKATLQPG